MREKDLNFVAALLDAGLVEADVIANRLGELPKRHQPASERARAWLAGRRPQGN
jgi:hypothetical protein